MNVNTNFKFLQSVTLLAQVRSNDIQYCRCGTNNARKIGDKWWLFVDSGYYDEVQINNHGVYEQLY